MKNLFLKLGLMSALLTFSFIAAAEQACYNLFSEEGTARVADLCLTGDDNTEYGPMSLTVTTFDTNKVIFKTDNFTLLTQSQCLDCNQKIYGAIYDINAAKGFEPFDSTLGFLVSPIKFEGKLNVSTHEEHGWIEIGPNKYRYSKSVPMRTLASTCQ